MKKCKDGTKNHNECEDLIDGNGDEVVVCHVCKQTLGKKCQIWARPCGYLRPVDGFNLGKKAEFEARLNYKM